MTVIESGGRRKRQPLFVRKGLGNTVVWDTERGTRGPEKGVDLDSAERWLRDRGICNGCRDLGGDVKTRFTFDLTSDVVRTLAKMLGFNIAALAAEQEEERQRGTSCVASGIAAPACRWCKGTREYIHLNGKRSPCTECA